MLFCSQCNTDFVVCPACQDVENLQFPITLCQFLGCDDPEERWSWETYGKVYNVTQQQQQQQQQQSAEPNHLPLFVYGTTDSSDGAARSQVDFGPLRQYHVNHDAMAKGFEQDDRHDKPGTIVGPDGGFAHYWHCRSCDQVLQRTDK
jgi:hypothetical protein